MLIPFIVAALVILADQVSKALLGPYLQTLENRTLPLALWNYQGQYATNTAMILACLTLSILPMIILFIIMQEKLIKGMMAGAVKG